VDLGRVATESADRLRLFADRQGLRLIVDVPARRLPSVRGDEARLGQVVVNLVHNALKFGRPGGPDDDEPRRNADGRPAETVDEVRVTVRAAGDEVLLSVQDHGVGIPKADQDRIFERFYKVDRARVRGGGTGLGLAIARHVVEQHGGRIRVESEEGRGSTFTVSLPVAVRSAAAVASA
jgi:two-component system, OmpR family, phosphate regulon sensor histidine kinase PhoR